MKREFADLKIEKGFLDKLLYPRFGVHGAMPDRAGHKRESD